MHRRPHTRSPSLRTRHEPRSAHHHLSLALWFMCRPDSPQIPLHTIAEGQRRGANARRRWGTSGASRAARHSWWLTLSRRSGTARAFSAAHGAPSAPAHAPMARALALRSHRGSVYRGAASSGAPVRGGGRPDGRGSPRPAAGGHPRVAWRLELPRCRHGRRGPSWIRKSRPARPSSRGPSAACGSTSYSPPPSARRKGR